MIEKILTAQIPYYTMDQIVNLVLASEKFQEQIRDGEKGYYDVQERIFIPKKVVPYLIKELTVGPSVVFGTSKCDMYFSLCQIRIKRMMQPNLKVNAVSHYPQIFLRYLSSEFLKFFKNTKLNFAALYIDIVGSTLLSMNLHPDKLSSLISIFTQEMSSLVPIHHGFVLKYAGDSVIAFFPQPDDFPKMCNNALDCAQDMSQMLKFGINRALVPSGFESLNIRIGIEAGTNQIMQVGGEIDIIGHTMNMAAKVTSLSKPNGICMGEMAFESLDENRKKEFVPLEMESRFWKYLNSKGEPYRVYECIREL